MPILKSSIQAVSDVEVRVEITMPLSQWKALVSQTNNIEERFKSPLRDVRIAVIEAVRGISEKIEKEYTSEECL